MVIGHFIKNLYYIKVWLNEGQLSVGDDIMYVLISGDIRPMWWMPSNILWAGSKTSVWKKQNATVKEA